VTVGDAAGRLVRLFALTGGRTRPSRADFTLISTVTAVDPPPATAARCQPEHTRILRLCAEPVAVAELAARLDLPVSVVVILLCDLLEAGRITVRPPRPVSRTTPDLDLLQKVRDGLGRL
jgi:predicted Rossmann fold nucleotide-binding protein DprA/Smf involved in DNA uptake